MIEKTPVPIRMYIGPGQAPQSAQPNPKIVPPIIYLVKPFCFRGTLIRLPSVVLIFLDF